MLPLYCCTNIPNCNDHINIPGVGLTWLLVHYSAVYKIALDPIILSLSIILCTDS